MSKYTYKKPQTETVDVTVPSGNVFKMERPSKYQVLFNLKALPASIANKAIETWQDQGIGNQTEAIVEGASEDDRLKVIEMSFKIRDAVLRLSVAPKIVLTSEAKDGEVSVDDISDADLDYLFRWVASGGSIAAAEVAEFRRGRPEDALASNAVKTKRAKAVAVSGAE